VIARAVIRRILQWRQLARIEIYITSVPRLSKTTVFRRDLHGASTPLVTSDDRLQSLDRFTAMRRRCIRPADNSIRITFVGPFLGGIEAMALKNEPLVLIAGAGIGGAHYRPITHPSKHQSRSVRAGLGNPRGRCGRADIAKCHARLDGSWGR